MNYLIILVAGLSLIVGLVATVLAVRTSRRQNVRSELGEKLDHLSEPVNEDAVDEYEFEVEANANTPRTIRTKSKELPLEFFANQHMRRRPRGRKEKIKPLERNLLYAGWSISPVMYYGIKVMATIAALIPAYIYATFIVQLLIIFLIPKLVDFVLEKAIKHRLEEFDKDYPVLLLQLVSFLKSGMIAMTALREAAKSLDDSSLVKREVGILNERLKLGLSEEQAINAFGEDIAHPEIELFVQSFLLHSRVGGNLSSTLERLAIQVRKRQQFRKEAYSAIASERISIYAIAVIMICLLFYINYSSPLLLAACFEDPTGQLIFQGGLSLIVIGFYWSSKITDITM